MGEMIKILVNSFLQGGAMAWVLVFLVATLCYIEIINLGSANGVYKPSSLFSMVVGIVIGYYFKKVPEATLKKP